MSQIDDFLSDKPSKPQASGQSNIDSFLSDAPPKKATSGDRIKDAGLSLAKGVVAVPEAAVGIADIFTGGRVGKTLENDGGAIGFRPRQAKEFLSGFQSEAYKDEQRKFSDAEGIVDKAAVAVTNPALVGNTVVESLPSMFAGGAAARAAGKAAGVGQAAMAGNTGRALAAGGEGAMMAGMQASEIRGETDDGLLTPKQSALAAGTGVVGGAIGFGGAQLAKRLGIGDVDQMIASGLATGTAKPGLGMLNRAGRGALTEGVFEELPQSLTETAFQNIALDRPVTQGMDEAAVLGTLAGGVMGAGGGVVSGFGQPRAKTDAPPVVPPAPATPPVQPQEDSPVVPEVAPLGAPLTGTGAGMLGAPVDPLRSVIRPSQAIGLDPAAGPLSAAAATAVDSGASRVVQSSVTTAPPAAVRQADQQPAPDLATRSTEELRTALRNAQDPAIRKAVAAELAKRKKEEAAAMPDPLQPSLIDQPQGEPSRGNETPQTQQAEAQGPQAADADASGVLTAPQEAPDVSQPVDGLRPDAGTSTGSGSPDAGAGMGTDLGAVRGRGNDAADAQPAVQGDAGQRPAVSAADPAALRPTNFTGQPSARMGQMTRATAGPGFTASDVTRNVQDAPQGAAAQAEAAPEAARGDDAAAGVPAEARSGQAQADGVTQKSKEDRQKAIDAETMETRKPVQVAQPTPMKRVSFDTMTLSGPKKVTAKLYELPGYDGPQLAVAEYKTSRGTGYKVYLPKSGAFIHDSNGVTPLNDALELAVLRIKNARDTISKREKTATPAAPVPGDTQSDGATQQTEPAKKPRSIVAKAAEKKAAEEDAHFVHSGLKIRTSRVKVGDDVQNRWVVQSPENAEREARGERQIGGDRIVSSRDEAIKTAEQESKRHAEDKAYKAEIDAREKAEREAAESKKQANKGKTLMERRADAILDKEVRDGETGQVSTRREWVQRKVEAGAKTSVTQEDKIKPMTRMQAFRADNRQQAEHDRKVKEAGKKDVYWLDGFEVTKTEYDYAQKLLAEQREQESAAIKEAAHESATSPKNELPQPTEAQKEAGNYKKGHITINGLDISIENPAGSRRRPEWPPLKHHYGYFKGSVGADKDHVDVFLTDKAGDASLPVFIVDQVNKDGSFDEHKVVMGTATEEEARAAYLANYEKGWTGLGAITQMPLEDFKAWVMDPAKTAKRVDVAQPQQPTAPKAEDGGGEAAQAAQKIEDFGEKIGGARKDRWKERGLALSDLQAMSESEGAELVTKANVWKPDYEALSNQADPVTAASVKVIYDRLAARPAKNTPEGRRQYVAMMQAVRKVYGGLKSAEDLKTAKLNLMYDELGWALAVNASENERARKNAQGIEDLAAHMREVKAVYFSAYKGRSDPFVMDYMDLAKVKRMIADGFPGKAEPWKTRLLVSRPQGGKGTTEAGIRVYSEESAAVGTPLTREQIEAGFYRVVTKQNKTVAFAPTKEDAEAAAKTIYERDMKGNKEDKPEPERPYLDDLKRDGLPQRIDRDVTSEDFMQAFGFRGVEFGNWSAQDERQRIINMAYDGLMDLAEIMGVPPRAMSLNGTLGMAFGARGGGRFLAHYEPGKLVINMTKLRGGGSLAHEWAHAMDHYFGELRRDDAYTTKARGASGWYNEEQYNGIARKRQEKINGEWKTVERMRLDNLRPEMAQAFDGVMRALFQKQVTKAEMVRSQELDLERTQALAITEKDPQTKAMYQRMAENKQQALEELRKDPEDTMYSGRGRSDYAGQAQALSGKSEKGYWLRPTEMFARAFESWVFDKVTAMGARSDYLVHGVEETRFAGGGYKGNPYPTGEERARINAAFDKLASTIQTRETEGGNVEMFSIADEAPPFYSALAREIEALPTKSAPVIGWQAALQGLVKNGKVKADELEWTGITDWLKLQTGKVSKEDVTAYLGANGVQVTETVLRSTRSEAEGMNIPAMTREELGEAYREMVGYNPIEDDPSITTEELRNDVRELYAEPEAAETGETKYSNYTLPGGSNYREVLLTLPVKPKDTSGYTAELVAPVDSMGLGEWQVMNGNRFVGNPVTAYTMENAIQTAANRESREKPAGYKSAHWDQPNVLAHIRVNDRTDADGKRVLFVEEIQSDFGQDAKKKGMAVKTMTEQQRAAKLAEAKALTAGIRARSNADRAAGLEQITDETLELNKADSIRAGEIMRELEDDKAAALANTSKIPRAPFIDKTDKWLALSLKRILKMAVDESYDRVAFVNGEQSAERYSLDKQISKVEWITRPVSAKGSNSTPPTDGTLRAWDKDGRTVIDQQMEAEDLGDNIGKELAQKLIDMAPSRQTGSGKDVRELAGIDLKVPAKGMRDFYDKIVPAAVKDVLKKVGGGQMESVQVGGITPEMLDSIAMADYDGRYDELSDRAQRGVMAVAQEKAKKTALTQPGFTITPQMREKVAGGLPLFRTADEVDAQSPLSNNVSYEPASQSGQEAVARLRDTINAARARAGSAPILWDAVAPPAGPAGATLRSVAGIAKRFFNREVVYVRFDGKPLFNGAVSRTEPGKIFLNVESTRPLMAVLGHELLHEMRKTNPRAYANLATRLNRVMRNENIYTEKLKQKYASQGQPLPSDILEELEADIVGDNFMDPKFWEEVGRTQPGLFRSVANQIMQWLDRLASRLRVAKPFGTELYLNDIAEARAAVAQAIGEFSASELGSAPASAGPDVQMSVASKADQTGTEAEAIAAGFTMKAYRGVSKAKPFNDTGTTWLTTSREVAEAYAEEVMGYDDPTVITVMVKPDGLKRHDASRLTDEQRAELGADDFGNPQAVGIYDRSDDHPLGGSRRNVTVIHAPKEAVWLVREGKSDQTETPAFKKWFGDSKVVDAQGKPLVVYHGTSAEKDFSEFRGSKLYFSPDPAYASGYADGGQIPGFPKADSRVMPVYLSIKNPLDLRDLGDRQVQRSAIIQRLQAGGASSDAIASITRNTDDAPMPVWTWMHENSVRQAIQGAGFDGVMQRENNGLAVGDAFIAFRPEQIKSATGNRGTFDPENPDIRFSIADARDKMAEVMPQKVMDLYSDATSSQRGFNRWWHKTVGTQLHKAKINKDYGRVFYAVQDFMHDVSRMATIAAGKAPTLLTQIESMSDVGKAIPLLANPKRMKERKTAIKQASDALFDGTLRYTRDASGKVVEAMDAQDGGLIWTDAELKDRGLSEQAITMYREGRAAIDQSLDSMLAADIYRAVTTMNPEMLVSTPSEWTEFTDRMRKLAASEKPDDAVKAALSAMKERAKEFEAEVDQLLEMAAKADGEEATFLFAAMEDPQRKLEAVREEIKKATDKRDRIGQLKKAGYAPLMRFGEYTVSAFDDMGQRVFFGMYESQFAANRAARKFQEQGLKTDQGVMSKKEFEQLKGLSPETAMLFAEMLGVEKNEAMQQWLRNAVAEQSALKRHIRRKGVEGFDDDSARVVAAFLTSNSRAASRALHSYRIEEAVANVKQGDVKDEAITLADYVNNPKEEAQAVRSLLFVNYIGGSVSSAMVNLTQTFVQTFPFLSQYGGAMKAGQRLGDAMKMALLKKVNDPELEKAIKQAESDGVIKPQEVFQLQAEASRTLGSNLYARTGLAVWGSFFQLAEQFNRRVAFIAAYQTARQEKISDPFAFAENAVDETQGIFNKGNRPNWGRGAIGATLFTFKTFTIQYVEFLKRMPPKQRAIGLAVLFLMAGAGGFPFAEDAEDVIDTVAQAMGYNFTSKSARDEFLRRTLGDGWATFLQSGVSPWTPFDVSQRLGMADLLPGTSILKKSETRKEDQALEIFGVAGSFVRDALKGEVRPIAFRNAAKAIEMYDMGIYRDTRGRKVMDVDPLDAVFKSIGLQPSKVASESRKIGIQYEKRALYEKVRNEITEQMALGQFERDPEKVEKAREAVKRWNEKNPEAPLFINMQNVWRRVREMNTDRTARFLKSTPKELRGEIAKVIQ